MNFKLMEEHTRYLKENAKGVGEMCKIMEEMRMEAFEEGRQASKWECRKEKVGGAADVGERKISG